MTISACWRRPYTTCSLGFGGRLARLAPSQAAISKSPILTLSSPGQAASRSVVIFRSVSRIWDHTALSGSYFPQTSVLFFLAPGEFCGEENGWREVAVAPVLHSEQRRVGGISMHENTLASGLVQSGLNSKESHRSSARILARAWNLTWGSSAQIRPACRRRSA